MGTTLSRMCTVRSVGIKSGGSTYHRSRKTMSSRLATMSSKRRMLNNDFDQNFQSKLFGKNGVCLGGVWNKTPREASALLGLELAQGI